MREKSYSNLRFYIYKKKWLTTINKNDWYEFRDIVTHYKYVFYTFYEFQNIYKIISL